MNARWLLGALAAIGSLAGTGLQAQAPLQKALHDDVAPHWIYDDFAAAVAQAKATKSPILALLRCVP